MSKNVIEFDRVTKDYPVGIFTRRSLRAVTEVTFCVQAGEVFGLLGPNRAGKTTMVKMLLGLCSPTSGNVTRLGKPLSQRDTLTRIGYVHEQQTLPRYWSSVGLLHYYGAMTLLEEPVVRKRVPELLEMVGLSDRRDEPISQFSKGMVQRLALAQALLNDPDLLVLDEPAEGLDLEGRRLVRHVVNERRRLGKTVLMVSHVLPEIENLCDRVAVLVRGSLNFVGPTAELLKGTPQPQSFEQALQKLYTKAA